MKEIIREIPVENLCLVPIVDNRSPIADSEIYTCSRADLS